MASLMQRVATAVHRAFIVKHGSLDQMENHITHLRNLMDRLTAIDVGFVPARFTRTSNRASLNDDEDEAPASYSGIWENDPNVTVSLFVLHPGSRIPLHDHPGMHGLIKVIHGTIKIKTYDQVTDPLCTSVKAGGDRVLTRKMEEVIDVTSPTAYLTPGSQNLHELVAEGGLAAFLDILSPSYDGDQRPCNYYREIRSQSPTSVDANDESIIVLVKIPTPTDFWTSHADYEGPDIDVYSGSEI